MCIVGIILGGFCQNFFKINQKASYQCKLGREIIKISIISMVQTHKLPYSARNKSKFQFIPSKSGYLGKFYSNLGHCWQNFTSLHIFIIILLYNSVGTCNIHGAKTIQLKLHYSTFNAILYYFCNTPSTQPLHVNCPSTTILSKKFKLKYFLTQLAQ